MNFWAILSVEENCNYTEWKETERYWESYHLRVDLAFVDTGGKGFRMKGELQMQVNGTGSLHWNGLEIRSPKCT